MAVETLPVTTDDERERKRKGAILRAIGLDKVPPEQREIALAIADRYGLDLMLKHVVLVDGKPYITRDGLLHVAHRSGALDGIEVTDPELVKLDGVGEFWRAKASVYRKDMSRPFTYQGRYPAKGGNQRFAPEMAVKVAEVMALRRAFDVSAPVVEERWDVDASRVVDIEPTITESIAAKRAAITQGPTRGAEAPSAEPPEETPGEPEKGSATPGASTPGEPPPAGARSATPEPGTSAGNPTPAPCAEFSPELGQCKREDGHAGNHANARKESWAA